MGIQAGDGEIVKRAVHREEEHATVGEHIDELVIVTFPRSTWDEIQKLGKRTNTKPAEVIGIALKLLDETLTEEARKLQDGAGSRRR